MRNSSLEDQMILIIDKYNRTSGKWIEYYKGEFNKTDCKLDYEKSHVSLKQQLSMNIMMWLINMKILMTL